jgi:hypothetical protein
MKKKISNFMVAALAIVPVMALGIVAMQPATANAATEFNQGLADGANAAKGKDQQSTLFGDQGIVKTITNVMLFIIGAVAVIMLVIGGIRYTVSNGDQGAVKSAKDTILYAIIGIVVAILAYAIVNFVVGSFSAAN